MEAKNAVVSRDGRIVEKNLPTFGAALAIAAVLDRVGCCGPYRAAESVVVTVKRVAA